MHEFQEKYITENNIDFNTIADVVSNNHLKHSITTGYLNDFILNTVIQIKNIEKDVRFKNLFNQFNKDLNKNNLPSDLSIFFSMMSGTSSAHHVDPESVHIIGLYGHTSYLLDNKIVILKPGDRLYIKKGTPHKAISMSPRIVFSFGIYNQ
jgi:ribosomal protein L16 Arg81 hydroxylase